MSSTSTPRLLERPAVHDELVRHAAVACPRRGSGSGPRAASPCSWRSGSRPRWRASARRRPSCAMYIQEMGRMLGAAAGRRRDRADRPATRRSAASGWPGRNGASAPPRRSAPCPVRRRRAGCRRSCAGSGGRRRRRCRPGGVRPDLRVHVRAVHVDLPAVLVNDRADLPDRLLEDAVGRRVGDHQRAEPARGAPPPSSSGRPGRCCRLRRRPPPRPGSQR